MRKQLLGTIMRKQIRKSGIALSFFEVGFHPIKALKKRELDFPNFGSKVCSSSPIRRRHSYVYLSGTVDPHYDKLPFTSTVHKESPTSSDTKSVDFFLILPPL